ncbi:hypothetical protein TCAP_00621 [Tolypocladium capitatum]|uniref:Uncharacterized protein n=1 Tax=Tolypocladium capitatum TaxID=45235 RepID=A0A2K3QPK2_9HYPO|nr:hypothetical protein TCAP_00621 [Tolypocladium capitatum]
MGWERRSIERHGPGSRTAPEPARRICGAALDAALDSDVQFRGQPASIRAHPPRRLGRMVNLCPLPFTCPRVGGSARARCRLRRCDAAARNCTGASRMCWGDR